MAGMKRFAAFWRGRKPRPALLAALCLALCACGGGQGEVSPLQPHGGQAVQEGQPEEGAAGHTAVPTGRATPGEEEVQYQKAYIAGHQDEIIAFFPFPKGMQWT